LLEIKNRVNRVGTRKWLDQKTDLLRKGKSVPQTVIEYHNIDACEFLYSVASDCTFW